MHELQRALALGNLHFSLAVCRHLIRWNFLYTLSLSSAKQVLTWYLPT